MNSFVSKIKNDNSKDCAEVHPKTKIKMYNFFNNFCHLFNSV